MVMFLNYLPPKNGISTTYIPHKIMKGEYIDWKKSCKIHFSAYVQVHHNRNLMNKLEERTKGMICLGTTGNLQVT